MDSHQVNQVIHLPRIGFEHGPKISTSTEGKGAAVCRRGAHRCWGGRARAVAVAEAVLLAATPLTDADTLPGTIGYDLNRGRLHTFRGTATEGRPTRAHARGFQPK